MAISADEIVAITTARDDDLVLARIDYNSTRQRRMQ